jgi:uncharacterized membrane protein YphA (DoxX/SURF4 family)
METVDNRPIRSSYWVLRWTFGLVPLLAGLDKFTNLLTFWPHYLSPTFARMLPLSPGTFMHLVGVVEVIAGLLVLSKLTRVGAYVVMAWLICIAINLVTMGMLDIAVRDLALAAGAFSLGALESALADAGVHSRAHRGATRESVAVTS